MSPARKVFVIQNDRQQLSGLSDGLLGFCRDHAVNEDAAHDLLLAVEEAVSNTIKYGYDDRAPHTIRVTAVVEENHVVAEIEDDGREFNPLNVPAPDLSLPVDQRPIGGLGIYLLRTVMDSVDYRRDGSRNVLTLAKRAEPQRHRGH